MAPSPASPVPAERIGPSRRWLYVPPSLRWKIRTLSGKSPATVPAVADTPFTITDDPPQESDAASPT